MTGARIRLAHPRFERSDLESLWPLLQSGLLVQGRLVAEFEVAAAARLGVDDTIAVSSGTAALHLALLATGVGPGTEVIVPAFTWPSAANVAEQLGASIVPVDIEPETLNLDLQAVAQRVTSRTRALVVVHQFGLAVDKAGIDALGLPEQVAVIEDAACAFGATDRGGQLAGTWGAVGCFSLHARKGLTAGEGGLLLSNDPKTRAQLRQLRNHGQAVTAGERDFILPGLNYRLTELAAVLGKAQLGRFDQALTTRRRLAARYREALNSLDGITIPDGLTDPGHTFQSFAVGVRAPHERSRLISHLADHQIESTVGSFALHRLSYYRRKYGLEAHDFPVAEWAHEKVLVLPLHERMAFVDVDRVVNRLASTLREGEIG